MITAATSFGFESIGTWLVSSSFVVAFMRFAKKRCSSGAMARSCLATMYHDGFVFHATSDTFAPKAEVAIGVCVAATTRERRLLDKQGRPDFGIRFYAVNKKGDYGSASMWKGKKKRALFAVADAAGARLEECAWLFDNGSSE